MPRLTSFTKTWGLRNKECYDRLLSYSSILEVSFEFVKGILKQSLLTMLYNLKFNVK